MELKTWVSGGQIGSVRDVRVLDSERLSDEDRAAVEGLVESADFFDLPEDLTRAHGNDILASTIEVKDGERSHSVTIDFETNDKYRDILDPIFRVVAEKGAEALT